MSQHKSSLAKSAALLRALSRNTNLLIAGSAIHITGDSDTANTLREMLVNIGARQGHDFLFLVDSADPISDIKYSLSHHTSTSPLVVFDTQGILKQNLLPFNIIEEPNRAGITGYRSTEGDFFVVQPTEISAYTNQLGAARLAWARRFMPVTQTLAKRLLDENLVTDLKIGICLIIEPKTAVLALELASAGAEVRLFASASDTDPQIAEELRRNGIKVYANSEADLTEEISLAREFLDWHPELLIDDGAHLIRLAHQIPKVLACLRGAAEETTSGIRPLKVMQDKKELRIPVIAVNDAESKTLFDNRHGTGQTCVFAILDQLEIIAHEYPNISATNWLVIGYGPVGEGVCRHARALGYQVKVAELNPIRALQAQCDGYTVTKLADGIKTCDMVVSATGVASTITGEMISCARPDTVFAVAGGVDNEIDLRMLTSEQFTAKSTSQNLALTFDNGLRAHILANGHGINYTAGEGNPIEIMDLSFGAQLSALDMLINSTVSAKGLLEGLHPLDPERDREISRLALQSRGEQTDLTSAHPKTELLGGRYHSKKIVPKITKNSVTPAQVYSAKLIIPITAPRVENGAVAVRNGRILHVGHRQWVIDALKESGMPFDEVHWDGVITPGLVNAHTHLQYTDMFQIGQSQYDGFDSWAKAFDQVYDNNPHDWRASAIRGTQLVLGSGTTACADIVSDFDAASALHEAGLHGIAYWEVMGWTNKDWQLSGHDQVVAELAKMPKKPGVGVSPHAPYSLETQPLEQIPDIVRNLGMRFHIHLAEAHMEGAEDNMPDHWRELHLESFRALKENGLGISSTEFIDHLGVLGPDCHIAHGIYMTAKDRSLLRARGTSVALCPNSNQVIGLDMPPIADYLNEGNLICVGTDSLSSATSLDLLTDVALLYRIARDQGYKKSDLHQRLFNAATIGGATALGLNSGFERIGQLTVGAQADLAFFDIQQNDKDDALANLVEAGQGTCRRTIVAGVTKYCDDKER